MSKPTSELPQFPAIFSASDAGALRNKASRGSRNLANLLSEEFETKIRQGLLNETEHHFAALFHRLAQKIQARLLRIFTTAQLIQHPMLQPFPPKLQRLT